MGSLTLGLTWVVVEWASLCDCTPAPGLETPTTAGAAAFPMGFADRRRPRHRPLPTPPPVPTSLFPSRPPGSGPVLVSPQTGCSWSLSAWRPSSSSSCWASAGVSAAPIPAAATSGAPAARKSAAAPRPVSTPHPPHVHSHSASVLGPRGGGARLPASWDSVTLEVMRGVVWGKVGQGGPATLHYHLHQLFTYFFTFHLFQVFPFEGKIMHKVKKKFK